jgi:hypothetical protein
MLQIQWSEPAPGPASLKPVEKLICISLNDNTGLPQTAPMVDFRLAIGADRSEGMSPRDADPASGRGPIGVRRDAQSFGYQ